MPPRFTRASLPRTVAALICGSTLFTAVGCRYRPAEPSARGPAERTAVSRLRASSDARIVRRFPGANVVTTQRGGFLVRVYSGRMGPGEPLYVIDGASLFVDPNRGVDWLRPDDVATIEVLKGPVETAVYGPRGANGVIVITTKRR